MDALQALIQSSKTKAQGKKWVSAKELKKEEEERILREAKEREKQEKEAEKERLKRLEEYLESKKKKEEAKRSSLDFLKLNSNEDDEHKHNLSDDKDGVPPMDKAEVQSELRKFREPITLFGETDMQRYKRLCSVMVSHHDDQEITVGQQNAFVSFMKQNNRKRGKYDDDDEDFDDFEPSKKIHVGSEANDAGKVNEEETKEKSAAKDSKNQTAKANDPTMEKALRVCRWVKKMLKEWEEDLQARKDKKGGSDNKMSLAMHRQTRKDLKPLLRKLKSKGLEEDVLEKLFEMVVLCEQREYVAAHDKYIALAIGNAAWPMGVTMVGIHERAGRSKIFTSEVAHILNDETTRKYIQMFKRLMSYSQKRYPANPSQMVLISTNHI